jgi:crotonobetainyl-CoA:carnitine CoA-transferase CaiB-like acyl-CoA transferase
VRLYLSIYSIRRGKERGLAGLGQHTDKILSKMLGLSKEEVVSLKREGIV